MGVYIGEWQGLCLQEPREQHVSRISFYGDLWMKGRAVYSSHEQKVQGQQRSCVECPVGSAFLVDVPFYSFRS